MNEKIERLIGILKKISAQGGGFAFSRLADDLATRPTLAEVREAKQKLQALNTALTAALTFINTDIDP